MAVLASTEQRPLLLVFHSSRSGRSRRVEGFIAQVLQHRRNHDTFVIHRIAQEQQPELLERFRVTHLPTLLVVDQKKVRGRLVTPKGCKSIEEFLDPWLQRPADPRGQTPAGV